MIRPCALFAAASIALVAAAPARAQRADENAVRSAEDAFGATVGRDSIGIYSPDDVRGFSAVVAGNLRIDGLYFDQQEAPTSHLIAGAAMRVGLAAQGFAFPAPTGIVDYHLRIPGDDASLSLIARGTSWGGYGIEADGQVPLGDTLGVGVGGGVYRDVYADGTWADYRQIAGIARWRPAPGIEIVPFAELSPIVANPAQPIYLTFDGAPPARLPTRYHGPDWDLYRGTNTNAGTLASAALGRDTTVRAGLFRSSGTSRSTFAHLLIDLAPAELARRVIIADPPRSYVSTSGELRLAQGLAEGPRRHLLIASLRGRRVDSRYGGSNAVDYGTVAIDAPAPAIEPRFAFGARTRDSVRQWSAGLAYSLHWDAIGDASFGLLRTDYNKRVATPGALAATAHDAPLLWNAAIALSLGRAVIAYASQANGLEEAGQAPDIAVNRNSLSPAVRTRQRDAGLRVKAGTLTLVAGVFEVRKPYDAVDAAGLFRRLGRIADRGVELSLAGAPTPGLTLIAGGVLLDARVDGAAVANGLIAARPVGSTSAKLQANADYAPPGLPAWSFDVGASWRARVVAITDDRSRLPPRATLDLGARYRFALGGARVVARAQATNVLGAGGYVVLGPGAYKRADERQLIFSLAADLGRHRRN